MEKLFFLAFSTSINITPALKYFEFESFRFLFAVSFSERTEIKNSDLTSLKNVKILKLGNLEEQTNLEMINTLINVEELTLHSYLMEDFINLKPILKLKKLKSLKIDGYVNIKQEDIQLISDMGIKITETKL